MRLTARRCTILPQEPNMSRHAATEPMPTLDAAPRFDWREWLAFAGAVMGTALFVSVVLGALVLVISVQAHAQAVDAALHGPLHPEATLRIATGLLLLGLALLPALRSRLTRLSRRAAGPRRARGSLATRHPGAWR